MLFPAMDRELLLTAIVSDSPDRATAERAMARVEQVAKAVREHVRADGVQWATDRKIETAADLIAPTELPKGYELPLAIGEDALQALRDLSGMGVRLHSYGVSVEERYLRYLRTVAASAWAEGVKSVPDLFDRIISG